MHGHGSLKINYLQTQLVYITYFTMATCFELTWSFSDQWYKLI